VNLVDPDGREPEDPNGIEVPPPDPNQDFYDRSMAIWNWQLAYVNPPLAEMVAPPPDYESVLQNVEETLYNKLAPDKITQKCKDWFTKNMPETLTPEWVRSKLSQVTIINPQGNTTLVSDIIGLDAAMDAGVTGWSIDKLFKKGFPSGPYANEPFQGWSPRGKYIYIIPTALNPETLAHEIFHKHSLMTDDNLKAILGVSNTSGTNAISTEFGKACIY
jgi:hypothetical protein